MTLSDDLLNKLAQYLAILLDANKQFNLTSIRDPDDAWRLHIIDSLTLLPGLEGMSPSTTVIDVGSGGGLPGIPLAIARPDLSVTLLEATGKKAEFLRRCVAELPLPNVSVIQDRAENTGQAAGPPPALRRRGEPRDRPDAGVARIYAAAGACRRRAAGDEGAQGGAGIGGGRQTRCTCSAAASWRSSRHTPRGSTATR